MIYAFILILGNIMYKKKSKIEGFVKMVSWMKLHVSLYNLCLITNGDNTISKEIIFWTIYQNNIMLVDTIYCKNSVGGHNLIADNI